MQIQAQKLPELSMQYEQTIDEIQTVKSLLQSENQDVEVGLLLSLARNYYQLDNYAEAERYYLQIIDQPICSSLDFKAMAISLLHNGKISLAKEFKNIYLETTEDISFEQVWGRSLSAHTSDLPGTNLNQKTNYQSIYGHLDSDGLLRISIDHGAVTGELNCGNLSSLSAIDFPVEDFTRLGSFTSGPGTGTFIYSYQEDNGYYSIFMVENKNGKWKKPEKIELGETLVNYIHPMFDKDLGVLFYSSDRSGGRGGFDLYSTVYVSGTWSANNSLGNLINTDKNEILPSYFGGKFCFSSNGHPGIGGYDIYFSSRESGGIQMLEAPFSSSRNEFAIFSLNEESALLIMENNGGLNLFEKTINSESLLSLKGRIMHNSKPVDHARILIHHGNSGNGWFTSSLRNGKFRIDIPDTSAGFIVEVQHRDYHTVIYHAEKSTLADEMVFDLKSSQHQDSPSPIVLYTLTNTANNEVQTTASDSGDGINPVSENGYFVIYGSTRSYSSAYQFWESWKERFPKAEIIEFKDKGIYRIGEYAGSNTQEAMQALRGAQMIKSDVWLLRPENQ